MPSAANAESGSTSMTVAAASPTTPSATLTFPAILPKAGSWRMARPKRMTADGHYQQPNQQQGIEHGLVRLPQEHQRRLLVGGGSVGVVEIGEPGRSAIRGRWADARTTPIPGRGHGDHRARRADRSRWRATGARPHPGR